MRRFRSTHVLTFLALATLTACAGRGGYEAPAPDEGVEASPTGDLRITPDRTSARTGDVIHFDLSNGEDALREAAAVDFSISAQPVDTLLAPPASAQITEDGRFVAEKPGVYTVYAHAAGATDSATVRIAWRDVEREIEVVGHGQVLDVHTSDLWIWEGVDGGDYAITGTWGADGVTHFWDVTDPTTPTRIDSVRVDARTVNDVKISEDGRIGVISREGASDRRNGIIILDVSDPRDVEIISEYTDGLTGGVHNLFIHQDHVYAVNNGRRYDVIDITDPRDPRRVNRVELDTPDHAVHDVWIEDGVAYSSNWKDGVVLVDVGAGVAGGSPSNPVRFASYAYPSGANHAAFPYHDEETGKFYVIAGDEIFPYGLSEEGTPNRAAGYIHFIDFTDPDDPREVARYQVPEAGSHNFWVEDDLLYVAYYNAGLRVVDISGELLGDLYRQGREIAWFFPYHERGKIPNAPFTWGPQPHKGNIFFSDWNSGLWVVRLAPERRVTAGDASSSEVRPDGGEEGDG